MGKIGGWLVWRWMENGWMDDGEIEWIYVYDAWKFA